MKKLKILLFPLSSFISHATRCLSIADELRARGHIVEFACSNSNRELIEQSGYKTHTVRQLCHNQIVVTGAPLDYLKRYQTQVDLCDHQKKFGLKEMAADDFKVLKNVKPDLVVCDSCPTSYLSATALDIPCVMIKNTLGYIDSNLSKVARKHGLDLSSELDFSIEKKMSREFNTDCIKLNNAFVKNQRIIPFLIPGIPEIEKINNINVFEKMSHEFIGTLEWNGWTNQVNPSPDKYNGKTVILVTMGSSFPFQKVIKNLIQSFPDDSYHIIINTGKQIQIPWKLNNQKNYEIIPYINLKEFLKYSDILICHSGHGSVMNAFKAGVPVLTIPFNGDQMVISKQVETLGCGLRIKKYPDDITRDELKSNITHIINTPSFKENSQKYGTLLKTKGDGAKNAVDYIESFYKRRQWQNKIEKEYSYLVSLKKEQMKQGALKVLFSLDDFRWHNAEICIAIARQLRNNGNTIAFICSKINRSKLERHNFQVFPGSNLSAKYREYLDLHEEYRSLKNQSFNRDEVRIKYELKNMIRDDLSIYQEFVPGIIIDAGRISTEISSQHTDIPCIKLQSFNTSSNVLCTNTSQDTILESLRTVIYALKQEFPCAPAVESLQSTPLLLPSIPSLDKHLDINNSERYSTLYLGSISRPSLKQRHLKNTTLNMNTTSILVNLKETRIYKNVLEQISKIHFDFPYQLYFVKEEFQRQYISDDKIKWIFPSQVKDYQKICDVCIHNGNYESTLSALEDRLPGISIPFYKDDFHFANLSESKNWSISIKGHPGQITQQQIQIAISNILENRESMQDDMTRVSGELAMWSSGCSRSAYVIQDYYNQSVQKRMLT